MSVYCPNNHELTHETAAPSKRYEVGARCDMCNVRIVMRNGFRHCEKCTFDLCMPCSAKPTYRKDITPLDLPSTLCKMEHGMAFLTSTPAQYAANAECGHCQRVISCPQQGMRHCFTCEFDLCPLCCEFYAVPATLPVTSCKKGHEMMFRVRPPSHYSGVLCDHCKTSIDSPERGFRHCPQCEFDLCGECIRKNPGTYWKPAQPVPPAFCPARHSMDYRTTKPGSYLLYATCGACKKMVNPAMGFRHCKACKYDLCTACVYIPELAGRPKPAVSVAPPRSSVPVSAATATAPPPAAASDSPLRPASGTSLSGPIAVTASASGSAHPQVSPLTPPSAFMTTPTTYCQKCSAIMVHLTRLPDARYGTGGAYCDVCYVQIPVADGFRHCSGTCTYDLCRTCCQNPQYQQTPRLVRVCEFVSFFHLLNFVTA